MTLLKLAGANSPPNTIADLFSASARVGTGSNSVINSGINMLFGYLLWSKGRNATTDHALYDSARGATKDLVSSSSAAETSQAEGLQSVSGSGYTIGSLAKVNNSSATYVDWIFRDAPKFFTTKSLTKIIGSDATTSLSALGSVGMVIVKRVDAVGSWYVWHKDLDSGKLLYLEQTAAQATLGQITVSGTTLTLSDGLIADGEYIVYAWADASLIRCGMYLGANQYISGTVTSSGSVTIPANVTSVTLTGKGGTGTTTYHPAVAASGPIYGDWYYTPTTEFGAAYSTSATPENTVASYTSIGRPDPPVYPTPTPAVTYRYYSVWDSNNQWYGNYKRGQNWSGPSQDIIGYTNPGSSAYYTYTTGASSSATLNGITYTYPGGYGGAATPVGPTTYTVPNTGHTLSFSIAPGGSLTYSYYVLGTSVLDLGFSPQFILIKNISNNGDWVMMDTARGLSGPDAILNSNSAAIETSGDRIIPTVDGFTVDDLSGDISTNGDFYIYMAISAP